MRRKEDSILVALVFLAFDTEVESFASLTRTLHVDLDVGAYCRVVKDGECLVLMAHVCNAVHIEQITCDV